MTRSFDSWLSSCPPVAPGWSEWSGWSAKWAKLFWHLWAICYQAKAPAGERTEYGPSRGPGPGRANCSRASLAFSSSSLLLTHTPSSLAQRPYTKWVTVADSLRPPSPSSPAFHHPSVQVSQPHDRNASPDDASPLDLPIFTGRASSAGKRHAGTKRLVTPSILPRRASCRQTCSAEPPPGVGLDWFWEHVNRYRDATSCGPHHITTPI